MKMQYLRILLAIVCFAGLGVTAKAETRRELQVTLPFEFVVSGKTLPAGTYTVSRFSEDKFGGLILSSYENRVSVFVHPNEVEGTRGYKPNVSFERVGASYFLSKIETAYDVYNIPVSRATIMEAEAKQLDSSPASGGSGSN
jgi:hypothetical protein